MTEPRPNQRIAADLRKQIENGYYRPGQQLPSGSSLMSTYGVARQTVQNAIDQLRTEGLVVSRPGAGVFVRERTSVREVVRADSAHTEGAPYSVERVTTRFATTEDASAAGVDAGSLLFAITRTTYDRDGCQLETERLLVPVDQHELVYRLTAT